MDWSMLFLIANRAITEAAVCYKFALLKDVLTSLITASSIVIPVLYILYLTCSQMIEKGGE